MKEVAHRPLGASDLGVSELCIGTYRFWKKDPLLMIPVMVQALGSGINFIDTSDNYPLAEPIIGLALERGIINRDELVIATKTGLATSQEEANEFAARGVHGDTSPERVRRQVDISLQTLGVEVIDLYQVHVRDPNVPAVEIAGVMNELIDQGKILYWGLANYNEPEHVAEMLGACDRGGLTRPITLQNGLGLLSTYSKRACELAQAEGLGVLAFSPLNNGNLTDEKLYARQDTLTKGVTGEAEQQELDVISGLLELHAYAEEQGHNIQQLGLAWLMRRVGAIPILGAYKPEHLDDLLGAVGWDLTTEQAVHVEAAMANIFPSSK